MFKKTALFLRDGFPKLQILIAHFEKGGENIKLEMQQFEFCVSCLVLGSLVPEVSTAS